MKTRWACVGVMALAALALFISAGGAAAGPLGDLVTCSGDEHEPNDDGRDGSGCAIAEGERLEAKLLIEQPQTSDRRFDQDWFTFWGRAGQRYRVVWHPDGPLDGALVVGAPVPPGGAPAWLGQSDSGGQGGTESVTVVVPSDGYYVIGITTSTLFTGPYTLHFGEVSWAPEPPAPPGAPPPTSGPYEPNDNYLEAQPLISGVHVREQVSPASDVDWWQYPVGPGRRYRCTATSSDFYPRFRIERDGHTLTDPQFGTSTLTIEFMVEAPAVVYPVVENYLGPTGGSYDLVCDVAAPAAPQPGGAGSGAGSGAAGGTGGAALPSSPAGSRALTFRPAVVPMPTAVVTMIDVRVYYDVNANQSFDLGEGVRGLSVYVLSGGQLVSSGFTGREGQAVIPVVGGGNYQVGVPLLGFQQQVRAGTAAAVVLRLPALQAPTFFPVRVTGGGS